MNMAEYGTWQSAAAAASEYQFWTNYNIKHNFLVFQKPIALWYGRIESI